MRVAVGLCAALLAAGCTTAGTAVRAPYSARPVDTLTSSAITAGGLAALALSPDGTLAAIADAQHGACLQPVRRSTAPRCAAVAFPAGDAVSAAFSPDGRLLALGADVTPQTRGTVWVVDVRTGGARAVPGLPGQSSATSQGGSPAYVAMLWAPGGDLLLISRSEETDGSHTRLVDVDPASLIPRVVAEATGPYEFQSGYVVAGGSTVVLTVFRGDQVTPDVVTLDLETGSRKEFSPGAGIRLVPLAVSPDGRTVVVGVSALAHPGPPRLLNLATGSLTAIPGLTGDFAVAAFSPDGSRIAAVDVDAAGALAVAVAALPSGRARTLSSGPGRLSARASLGWSAFDVLSVTVPQAGGGTAPAGWSLAG